MADAADDFGDFDVDDSYVAEWWEASFDELCWRLEDRAAELLDDGSTISVSDALADAAADEPDHDERDVQEAVRVVTASANFSARTSLTATARKAPVMVPLTQRRRGRDCRVATNTRTRGSRRTSSRSAGGGSSGSDDPDESEPPRLRLWRHPHFGSCSAGLIRLLIGAGS